MVMIQNKAEGCYREVLEKGLWECVLVTGGQTVCVSTDTGADSVEDTRSFFLMLPCKIFSKILIKVLS